MAVDIEADGVQTSTQSSSSEPHWHVKSISHLLFSIVESFIVQNHRMAYQSAEFSSTAPIRNTLQGTRMLQLQSRCCVVEWVRNDRRGTSGEGFMKKPRQGLIRGALQIVVNQEKETQS